jgi:hypothetical protein
VISLWENDDIMGRMMGNMMVTGIIRYFSRIIVELLGRMMRHLLEHYATVAIRQ